MSLLILFGPSAATGPNISGWGGGPWGASDQINQPWGTGAAGPPPSLIAVTSPYGRGPSGVALCERRGGTVVTIGGTNFRDPMTVEVLSGGGGSFTVEGTGYIFDPAFDVRGNRIFAGLPALADGLYHLRVTNDGGVSNVLIDALEYALFPEEWRVVNRRRGWAKVWDVGPAFLTAGSATGEADDVDGIL